MSRDGFRVTLYTVGLITIKGCLDINETSAFLFDERIDHVVVTKVGEVLNL